MSEQVLAGRAEERKKVWVPCRKTKTEDKHKWDNPGGRQHRCSVCQAVGWSKHLPVPVKRKYGSPIHLYICPRCKGPTTEPQAACPNCIDAGDVPTQMGRKTTWEEIPLSGQRAIRYLMAKDKPVTVSRDNGGAAMSVLATKGIVRKNGDRSGQSLWELTEEARRKFAGFEVDC